MIMSRPFRKILPFSLLSASFLSYLLSTTSLEATMASIKAVGMGGCAVAYPQDALSSAWNPACAMFVGNRFDANAAWVQSRGKMTLHDNTFAPSPSTEYKSNIHPNVFDAEFGANYIVCGSYDVAIGLIGYNKAYLHTHYSSVVPFIGQTEQSLEAIQEVVAPVFAVRLDCHAFGIAIQLAGQRFKNAGLENFANPLFSTHPNFVTDKGHAYNYGVGFVFGWLWHMYPGVRMGATYETNTTMNHLKKYRGFFANRGELKLPERFSLGFSFDFTCHCHGAIDLQVIHWTRTTLGNKAFSDPQELIKNKLGSCHGPGFGWKNQPFVRTGVDYSIPCINTVLRGGFRWCRTPIRPNDTGVNILTLETAESVITVGATCTPWQNHEFSFCYAYGFDHTVHGNRNKPLSPAFGGGTADLTNGLQLAKIGYGVSF